MIAYCITMMQAISTGSPLFLVDGIAFEKQRLAHEGRNDQFLICFEIRKAGSGSSPVSTRSG